MSHFAVVLSGRVNGLRFNVPELKGEREKRGEQFSGTWVKFENGLLDTKAAGYSEAEAGLIRKRLEKMKIHGVQLIENEDKEIQANVKEQVPNLRFGEGDRKK